MHSECRSRGREFDPGPVMEINHEMISTVNLLHPLIQEGALSVTSECMCTKFWLKLLSQACRFPMVKYVMN